MKIKSLIIAVMCTGVVALASHTKSCKYWCKSDNEEYYCCPSGKSDMKTIESMWPMMTSPMFWIGVISTTMSIHHAHQKHQVEGWKKEKRCPPLRTACPRSFDWYDPPKYCDMDEECHSTEKCCYDVCLEHKSCKPAE